MKHKVFKQGPDWETEVYFLKLCCTHIKEAVKTLQKSKVVVCGEFDPGFIACEKCSIIYGGHDNV